MKTIVITGSTRGIGYSLAKSLLQHGCNIVITGKSDQSVSNALRKLSITFSTNHFLGVVCDVRNANALQALWDQTVFRFNKIDIWINNAGISNTTMKAWELPYEEIKSVIDTNLIGTINGTKVAMQGMLKQESGAIYNMEGMGSDGRFHDGLSIYGTSKSAVHYFTKAVIKESYNTNIIIGSIQPGMVITDMIKQSYADRQEEFEKAKKVFNIIADRVENVAPWIAKRVLENHKTGTHIQYLSRTKIFYRFLTTPFTKRDLFTE